ncbi:MAG TPA: PAS domain S-box protein, partial [Opitutus sp.]|nr:PAS domain S-box protein [Opitutus sp.]
MASDPIPHSAASADAASAELARVQEALRLSEAGRRESRTFFEKSFEANPAFMTIARIADGCLLEVNPAFVRGSGYSREEAIGRSTLDLNLWVHRDERDEFVRRMQESGSVRDFEASFRTKSGEIRVLLLNADVIQMEGPPCMLTVGVDISERRRRERVQAATYEISQALLAGGDLSALFREIHRIIGGLMSARNFYVALLSPDGEQLTFPLFVDEHAAPPPPRKRGNGFSEYILATGEPLLATAEQLVALLEPRGFYQRLERPAAQRLGAPLRIGGRAIGVIALQDYDDPRAYTEEDKRLLMFVADQAAAAVHRREAEEALRRAELQYRGIFENALEGLYQTSPDGRFMKANRALARMCGYDTPEELIRTMNDIGHQLYVERGRRAEFLRMIEDRDEVTDFHSEIYRRDGSRIWIGESVRVIRAADGTVSHFEGVAVDITQQREAARALQAAKDAADAASRAKSYFLASVSHELRTPLNGILGYTQILRRDPELKDRQRDGVRVIHESAEHLLALINDVLDLSKIEAGRIELHAGDFDLVEFVAAVERVFVPRARDKGLRLETQVEGNGPRWVRGDEQRLRQVVFNLVANAVKFTERGGVVLSVSPGSGDAWRFSVSDTGPGIAPEELGKLFEPFSQLGT